MDLRKVNIWAIVSNFVSIFGTFFIVAATIWMTFNSEKVEGEDYNRFTGNDWVGIVILFVIGGLITGIGSLGVLIFSIMQIVKHKESSKETIVLIAGILGVMGGGLVSIILSFIALNEPSSQAQIA